MVCCHTVVSWPTTRCEKSCCRRSDIDIAASGHTVYGENEEDIVKGLNGLRTPLSFCGSTQTYHEVLRLRGLEYLGQKLHSLSLDGQWQKMRNVITEDELRELIKVSVRDDLPRFVTEHRKYASQMSFERPATTDEEKSRNRNLMQTLQDLETLRVPRGLEIPQN